MMSFLHSITLGSVLWLAIGGAWIYVLALGLEADKPLSGDLPGQAAPHAKQQLDYWEDDDWNVGDRLGETSALALFGAMGMLLFFLLYWIITAHGYLW